MRAPLARHREREVLVEGLGRWSAPVQRRQRLPAGLKCETASSRSDGLPLQQTAGPRVENSTRPWGIEARWRVAAMMRPIMSAGAGIANQARTLPRAAKTTGCAQIDPRPSSGNERQLSDREMTMQRVDAARLERDADAVAKKIAGQHRDDDAGHRCQQHPDAICMVAANRPASAPKVVICGDTDRHDEGQSRPRRDRDPHLDREKRDHQRYHGGQHPPQQVPPMAESRSVARASTKSRRARHQTSRRAHAAEPRPVTSTTARTTLCDTVPSPTAGSATARRPETKSRVDE